MSVSAGILATRNITRCRQLNLRKDEGQTRIKNYKEDAMKSYADTMTEIEITTNLDEYDFPNTKENAVEAGHELLGWATMVALDDEDGWNHKKMEEVIKSEFGEDAEYYGEGEELEENSACFLIVK